MLVKLIEYFSKEQISQKIWLKRKFRVISFIGIKKSVKDGSSHCGSVVMNLANIHEEAGSIPDPTHWVKDPVLTWTVVLVPDMAWIPHCCVWGIGHPLSSDSTPSLGNSICCRCGTKKAGKKKKRERERKKRKDGRKKSVKEFLYLPEKKKKIIKCCYKVIPPKFFKISNASDL